MDPHNCPYTGPISTPPLPLKHQLVSASVGIQVCHAAPESLGKVPQQKGLSHVSVTLVLPFRDFEEFETFSVVRLLSLGRGAFFL